jgi:hypothetical protein
MKDLGKAFTFPFKDPAWFSKFLFAALFMILCLVGLGLFVLAGYFVQVTQRVMRKESELLPDWSDVGIKFVVGFKFCIVYFIYILPIILLTIPMIVLSIIAEMTNQPEVIGLVTVVYLFGFVLLVMPYTLALTLAVPIVTYRFAAREKITDALDIAGVFRSFKRNWQGAVVVALISIGVQSFAFVGLVLLIVGVFFTIFYSYLVSAYLNGALYLETAQQGATA